MGNYNVEKQYATSSNLNARIQLHERFSTNITGWTEWYFGEMTIPMDAKILDVGCGTASFWKENASRVPDSIELVLVDASKGMITEAKSNIESVGLKADFSAANLCALPFPDNHFDIVMANHMLYHLEDQDRKKGIKELSRVLKGDGTLYASTIGEGHLREFPELLSAFDASLDYRTKNISDAFSLQNGSEQLSVNFSNVKVKHYDCDLAITEGAPIVQYVQSTMSSAADQLKHNNNAERLTQFLNRRIIENGPIHITKETGYLSAKKKI
ncbi:class I SAM-dependent methyltransferase [Alkalihalobacillus sp. AL-G]|uniref:class I SAM-dependent methyltransferase n=1 Tax=Alkalihalobacillus sp. AL-G TaxID=2926399 RepID=UPI00272D1FAD|nr:class I SAM-dependent methyltransferase [Alkalihalobacillus sp. AL-G]WLD93248.1 class I SAM-dependent methyltransferase [Alkalihalobacillus sp. AL-G]